MSLTRRIGLSSALLFAFGCSGVPTQSDGDSDPVSSVNSEIQSAWPTFIVLSDSRAASSGVVTLLDLTSGATDSEAVRTTLYPPGGVHNQAYMRWGTNASNRLSMLGFGGTQYPEYPTYSGIKIDDFGNQPGNMMRVTLKVFINDACYEDYEDINWQVPPLLYFNGNYGIPDGSCYHGNMLRTSP